MPSYDFSEQRFYLSDDLQEGAEITCDHTQVKYLTNVLRLETGDQILIFNGRDGEWRAEISRVKRNECRLTIMERVRLQEAGPDIHYLFAPLRQARLDYMVQKATEMGVAVLQPVLTHRTIAGRVNLVRMRANAVEAAERCGILRVPEIVAPVKLEEMLDGWDPASPLIYCDEGADVIAPLDALGRVESGPVSVLVGPEGGFDGEERDSLRKQSFVVPISLGPRVLRADTAAVAALALVNAVLGDWRSR